MCQVLRGEGGGDGAPDNSRCKGPEAGQFEQLRKGREAGNGWA